ncbi:hsp70 nucleotide exchange factor fes1 [Tulasnella sp. UAMH 9824]|nr:hsp70 nucleotide exchange factor fes1 [Tulasnella sp. UAMH 9824]
MASMAKMRDLLAWSTEHQVAPDDPNYVPPRPLQELDPGLIDMILGKPDAVRMRDAMAIAVDESKSEEDRVTALDDMELLIESLDNANDMEVLKLWEPVLNLATSPLPAISAQALWVALKAALEDPHITVRRKAAFLLNSLLLPDASLSSPASSTSPLQTSDLTRSAIDSHNILPSLTTSIVDPKPFGRDASNAEPDADYEEKAVRGVVTYLEGMKGSQTDVGEGVKKDLRAMLGEKGTERGKGWGLEEEEWDVLQRHAE